MTSKRPTKAEREEAEREARRQAALEQAKAIGLQAIHGADGDEYSIEDAPLEDLEAVLARKARRRP